MDLDPQSSLSEILVSNNGAQLNELQSWKTLNYVFDLNISKIKKYHNLGLKFDEGMIQKYKKGCFDFVASSLFYRSDSGMDELGLDELAVRMEDTIEYLSILKGFIDSILDKKSYDFIIMDCPPSNNLITRSAFLLSDYYIIPTILDGISTNGVAHYINTVLKTYKRYCVDSEDAILARHYFGERPKLIGIFCTFIRKQVNYDSERDALVNTLRNECTDEDIYFFNEEINNYIDIARSTEIGESSIARKDYVELTESVLKRIDSMSD